MYRVERRSSGRLHFDAFEGLFFAFAKSLFARPHRSIAMPVAGRRFSSPIFRFVLQETPAMTFTS
jgi:hypothetical protein